MAAVGHDVYCPAHLSAKLVCTCLPLPGPTRRERDRAANRTALDAIARLLP